MCAVGKNDAFIKIPLKVILTENGATTFMQQKKKIRRIKLADNSEEYGIFFTEFRPRSLQQLILLDYVSKMELCLPEIGSKRKDIKDVAKIVIFSMLYKQFDKEILESLLGAGCVVQWNRHNPSSSIDENRRPNDQVIRSKLLGKDMIISEAREKILRPIWDNIVQNDQLSSEEKNIQLLLSEKFINRLSLFSWFIIIKFFNKEGFDEIINIIRSKLNDYMKKSSLSEYISLMIIELAQKSENENFKKIAKVFYKGVDDLDSLLLEPEIRAKMIKELMKRNELVFLSLKLGGSSFSIGKRGMLQVTLYNNGDQFNEVKENIEEKKSVDTSINSLVEFYNSSPDAIGDSSMGLYYLSYLDEECRKVNVKFESIVNQYSEDLTVINLNFYF